MSNCTTNHSYYNCRRPGLEICVGLNISSVAVNVIHLMVILSISLLSENILISQSVQDISGRIIYCLTFSCGINRRPPGTKLFIILIWNTLLEGFVVYFAWHLTYQGHFVKLHFEKLFMFSFWVSVAYKGIFIVNYEDEDAMCVNNIAGSRHMSFMSSMD